jgi:hypothetical protein
VCTRQSECLCSSFCCRSWAADEPAEFYIKYSVMRAHQLYLLIYMALVLLFIGLLLTRDTLFGIWSVRASTNLHNTLFSRVLSAPVLFFLRTPVGDVLNAFARDQVRCHEVQRLCTSVCLQQTCMCSMLPYRPHTQHCIHCPRSSTLRLDQLNLSTCYGLLLCRTPWMRRCQTRCT